MQLFVGAITQHFLDFLFTKLQLVFLKIIILFKWASLLNNRLIFDLFRLIHNFLGINIEGRAD
jgi:hypothetical protein